MKITTIRIQNEKPILHIGPGTGKVDKQETYPCTPALLKKLRAPESTINAVYEAQHKVYAKDIPDFDSFKNLRDYQLDDVKFLTARKSAGCFNEQRTGKTPTALSTMKLKGVTKLLIIAPASTLYTWAEECKTWWSNELPIVVADGPANKRTELIKNWKTGALIIGYECLRQTIRKVEMDSEVVEYKVTGDLGSIRKHKDIEGCILDEAHRIKNHKSRQAEALFSLSDIPNKLALSGTPAPGKQHEVFSILHWLFPQVFTGYWRFIDYYFEKNIALARGGDYTEIGSCKRDKEQELQEFLDAISTRRLRASVMPWLPEKDRQVIKLPQTNEQERYIRELNESFEITGTDVDAVNVLARLIKVRQILLGPSVLDLKGKSPKIEWIKQYLKDYPEKSVIIFSNFTTWLHILSKELNCDNLIIGETPKRTRDLLKTQFQSGKIKLLLINIKAGKEGITLDKADVTIFTDKYPPVGDIMQAEDRFVATTKDKANKEHTIIDLVMKDSYEENILYLLKNNAKEIDIINNYINYLKGRE